MISNAQLQGVPLLVLANKQDLQVRWLWFTGIYTEQLRKYYYQWKKFKKKPVVI